MRAVNAIRFFFLQMLVLALGMLFPWHAQAAMHDGFVHVSDNCQNIIQEIRYFSSYNFVGERINGYLAPQAILTEPAANALCKAATAAEEKGYTLKIYDAYRPQSAVDHFVRWGMNAADTRMKTIFLSAGGQGAGF